ncbi:MAG: hypothetical protein ACYDDF_09820 [Thermoplasmatota archaeon]
MAFLAIFDILGFQEKLKEGDLKSLIQQFGDGLDGDLGVARSAFKNEIPRETEFDLTCPDGIAKYLAHPNREDWCRSVRFSDTILLYDPAEVKGLGRIVISSANLAARCMSKGIPIRGAIVRGEFYADERRNLYLGKGLIEAYDWAQKQDWAGAIVAPGQALTWSSEERTRYQSIGLVVSYPVPLKEGPVVENLAIGWPVFFRGTPAEVEKRLKSFVKSPTLDGQRKIDGAVRFIEQHRRRFPAFDTALS